MDGNGREGKRLLEVTNLTTSFGTDEGLLDAVDDVSFSLGIGETLGIVGESGCGKSVTALSLLRLVRPPGIVRMGSVLFEGHDLLKMSEEELREVRGSRIGMIFQDPTTSLNPVHRVGDQIAEVARVHGVAPREANELAVELIEKVGLSSPRTRAQAYPHELSGGMRQRIMIAIAVACSPALVIADEPTTALDVTIQAQILELLKNLCSEMGTSVILITHDLGIAAGMCDRMLVMYAGRVVEAGDVRSLFTSPQMPYTRALLEALPRIEGSERDLVAIDGAPPDLASMPNGCRFAPRCGFAREICRTVEPELTQRASGQIARCHGTAADGWIGVG